MGKAEQIFARVIRTNPELPEVFGARALMYEAKGDLEGLSLVPLLKDPKAKRERPAVITYQKGNHAVRDERWRYIGYHTGEEELYDMHEDPNEWHNLAGDPKHAGVKKRLADLGGSLPTKDERSPARFDAFVKSEIARWSPILKAANTEAK